MKIPVEAAAAEVARRVANARNELAAAQDLLSRSVDLVSLFEGRPLAELNAAVQHLAQCATLAAVRARDRVHLASRART